MFFNPFNAGQNSGNMFAGFNPADAYKSFNDLFSGTNASGGNYSHLGNMFGSFPFSNFPGANSFQFQQMPQHYLFSLFGHLQELAGELSKLLGNTTDKTSPEFQQEYRRILEKLSGRLYHTLFSDMSSHTQAQAWTAGMRNFLAHQKNNTTYAPLMNIPGFGPMAEQWEKGKEWILLCEDYIISLEKIAAVFEGMEKKVHETFIDLCLKKEPSEEVRYMEYFDIWVKALEQEYKAVVMTAAFSSAYGNYTNSAVKLRLFMQPYIDEYAESLGLPSKRSTDTVLKHISSLRKQNRKLQETVRQLENKVAGAPKKETGKTAEAKIQPTEAKNAGQDKPQTSKKA